MKRNKGPTILGSPPEGWGEQPLKPFSFLLPPGNRSSFRVVPDTPTNTPKSLADSPGVTMVLETPEALMGESRVVDNPSGGPEGDVGHTSSALGVVKVRRRNMISFLESDFSHKEDVSSGLSDNDAAGSSATPKEQWLWSRVVPALGTPQSSRRRKSTMANIIVPSDLNDEDFLATKLNHIQQEEKSARVRRRSSACSTPRHHGPANATPEATKRDPQLAPMSTRARPSRTSGLGTPRRSEVMDRETRGRTTTTTTTSAENCNATILFNDEDLQLTPVHCGGQPKIGPDRHTTTTNTTPSQPGTSEDTEVTEDTLRRLQTRKSPLLQLRKFSTVATQKMVEELKDTPQRTRRGEGLAERLGGAECHPLVLHSTPQRKDRAGSTDSACSGGGASLPSPAKDPSCVLKGVVAYVEVRVDGENRSAVIKEQLGALGAKVETRLTRNTTHVIFRDGSKAAFLRARDRGLHILSTLWVEACRVSLSRAPETNYPSTSMETYSSDIHIPKKFKRSMHVKDIEEDLKLVEARIRRRNKKKTTAAATTSPTDPIPPGYCTPRHRRPREDVNSPLYSIRHLLSPHLKESSVSCEEEEDEDGICTPLAKRLFKKLMSRHEAGRGKGTSQESVAEDSALGSGGGEACQAGSTSDNQSEPQESLKLRLEDSDSFSRRTSSEVVSEGDMSLPRRLSMEGDSLPRRLTEAPDKSAAVGRSGMSNGESVESLPVRLGRNSSEVSQDEFALPRRLAISCTVSEGQGGAMESSGGGSGGGGGGGGRLADSDSSGCVVEAPVVVRRRQSMRLRARVPESEGFSESEDWTTERNKKNKKTCSNTEQSLASLPAENNTHRKTNGTKTNLINETRGKNKMRQTTPLETTPENHKKSTTNTNTNTERPLEEDNNIPASQIPFTNTQRTRRRLMVLEEEITPTQDLITPATPTDKRTGPYHHLLHPQARKTKRKRLSRELFAKKCSDVLTSTTTVPSTSETGATGATTRPTGGGSTNGSSSSTSDSKEHKGSSGDDSVFGEARIVMLPRARRSTEEFKMVAGHLKPRGSVRGSRGRRSCPPGRFSSSTTSGSSASSMCLTSLHSSDKRTVLPIIRKLRGYHVVENVDQRTSHVVCGEPRRTINLLLGIARGCWVLDVSWVYRSLEANTWAPEEPFELASFAPGAKACRQKREAQGSSYQHTLFSKVGGVCVLDGSSPPPAQLKELLELCGATVVSSVRNARVVVGGGDGNTLSRKRRIQVTHVSEKWVLDSIQHYKLHPLQDYILS